MRGEKKPAFFLERISVHYCKSRYILMRKVYMRDAIEEEKTGEGEEGKKKLAWAHSLSVVKTEKKKSKQVVHQVEDLSFMQEIVAC